ncbi:MAG TPA: hypothetical protein V6D19_05605 [Stenomitos sp.]
MFLTRTSRSLLWGCLAMGALSCAPAVAQQPTEVPGPIQPPSINEAVEATAGTNKFWPEITLLEDVKTVFSIGQSEYRIEGRSKKFEALYRDLMMQQQENHDILRPRDLPSPFSTTVQELQK